MTARAAAVLPVRFASTRLPGKPLLAQTGQSLIQHVWEQVRRARRLDPVIVATDDARIAEAVRRFGGQVEMTAPTHPSGSDRVAEVVRRLDLPLVVNVQGDEPEVDPGDLDRLVERLASGGEELITLARRMAPGEASVLADPNVVKVVLDARGRALYFSRCPVPHGSRPEQALAHQGVYGWRREALLAFAAAPPCEAERAERLEQLRALHMGLHIGVVLTAHASLGIDTPSDYAAFVKRCAARAASGAGGSP